MTSEADSKRTETVAKILRVLAYARPHWKAVCGLYLVMLLSAAVAALHPWPLKLLVDTVLGQSPPPFAEALTVTGLGTSRNTILVLVVALSLVLFALDSILDVLSSWGWTVVGRAMSYGLARDLFARLQRRSLGYHSRVGVGETMMRVGDDCWIVDKLLASTIFSPVHAVLTLSFVIWLMFEMEPLVTAAILVTAPLILAASTFAGRTLRRGAEARRSLAGDLRAHVQRTLAGLPVVQSFAQEPREQAKFEDIALAAVRTGQSNTVVAALNGLAPGLLTTLGSAFVLWICAYQVLNGRISLGEMLVFIAYYGTLRAQISALAGIYPTLQGLGPTIERVNEALSAGSEVSDKPNARPIGRALGNIELERVSFAYDEGRPAIEDVSFSVAAGEKVALVGPTGAGKSTLVSLIPRFFDPHSGRVLIDGKDIRDVTVESVRSQVGLVLQEPFLLPMTIAENIGYGRPDASAAEIEAAARAANAHGFIMRLPQGYGTEVGERGTTLSGGERQRISIARALVKDAPILILDEPTSALDAGTEAAIMEALRTLVRGRTTFIIAHRLATVQNADRIIVLENGRVAGIGTHEELLAKSGLYARYCALQFPEKVS